MATKDNKFPLCPLVSGDISLNGGKSRLTSTLRSSSSQTGGGLRMVNSSETSPSHPDLSTLNTTSSSTHHTIFQCARTTDSLSSQHIHLTNTICCIRSFKWHGMIFHVILYVPILGPTSVHVFTAKMKLTPPPPKTLPLQTRPQTLGLPT